MAGKLNINNSASLFNFELVDGTVDSDDMVITPDNAEEILSHMRELKDDSDEFITARDEVRYYYDATKIKEPELLSLLFEHGGYLVYHSSTDYEVPGDVIELTALYRYTSHVDMDLTDNLAGSVVESMQVASSANKLTLQVNCDDWTPYMLIVSLSDLRYFIDNIVFRTYNKSTESYYGFFTKIRDALSSWKMLIQFVYRSAEEREDLEERAEYDKSLMKSRSVW